MVFCNSAYGVVRISWHEMQNVSVLVSSIAQLKPPQNKTPPIAPTMSSPPSENRVLGREMTAQVRAMKPLNPLCEGVPVSSLNRSLPRRRLLLLAQSHAAPPNAVI